MALGISRRSVPGVWLVALLGLLTLAVPARAAINFPEAEQVATDFPDEAQCYAALELLSNYIVQFGSKPTSQGDAQKRSDYQAAAKEILRARTANGSVTPEYTNFLNQTTKLRIDPKFRQKVMSQYHLHGAG